jgi:DNA-binding GntR family transcriptional regulator
MKSSSTATVLADTLRREIARGRWADGAVLRQEDLAAEYAVSRIPVREALAQLQSEGLIAIETHRGARVVRLTPADIAEIFELRLLLESEALRLAIPGHTSRSLNRVRHVQEDLELENDPAGWMSGDRAFHEALYAPCDRPRLLGLVRQQRLTVERHGLAVLTPDSRRAEWGDEHRALIAAVAEGDASKAVNHLREHLAGTRDAIIAAFR